MRSSDLGMLLFGLLLLTLTCTEVSAQGEACTTSDTCGNGRCENLVCVCISGYVSRTGTCNYEQRDKIVAFMLSFFLGWTGADWFYLSRGIGGYIVAGVFKLLMGLTFFVGICIGLFAIIQGAALGGGGDGILGVGLALSFIVLGLVGFVLAGEAIWITVDWIRILANAFKDGNGVELKPW